MPIIKITQDDINRSKPPDAGWYLVRIEKFSEDDTKDKKSKNWVFDLKVLRPMNGQSEENNGRFAFARFNSKAPGMVISSGFLPAALQADISQELEFNPDDLIGKELFANVKDDTYEGKLVKRTEEFASTEKPPF